MLYETAARAEEILTLDVSDLDLANKRTRGTPKGSRIEEVSWQASTRCPAPLAGRGRRAVAGC